MAHAAEVVELARKLRAGEIGKDQLLKRLAELHQQASKNDRQQPAVENGAAQRSTSSGVMQTSKRQAPSAGAAESDTGFFEKRDSQWKLEPPERDFSEPPRNNPDNDYTTKSGNAPRVKFSPQTQAFSFRRTEGELRDAIKSATHTGDPRTSEEAIVGTESPEDTQRIPPQPQRRPSSPFRDDFENNAYVSSNRADQHPYARNHDATPFRPTSSDSGRAKDKDRNGKTAQSTQTAYRPPSPILSRRHYEAAERERHSPNFNVAVSASHSEPDASDAFFQRVMSWKKSIEQGKERRRSELEEHELQECTFAPAINPPHRGIAANNSSSDPHLFYHRPSSPPRMMPSSNRVSTRPTACDRLYEQYRDKLHRLERERQKREDEEIKRNCTFRPVINPSPKSAKSAKERRRPSSAPRALSARRSRTEYIPSGTDQCTFVPRTNRVSKTMSSVRRYLERDPFERLSSSKQPITDKDTDDHDGVDRNSYLFGLIDEEYRALVGRNSANDAGQRNRSRPSSAPACRRSTSTEIATMPTGEGDRRRLSIGFDISRGNSSTKSSMRIRASDFGDFLQRQSEHLAKKQLRIKGAIEWERKQLYQPHINEHSAKLAAKRLRKSTSQEMQEALHAATEQRFDTRDVETSSQPSSEHGGRGRSNFVRRMEYDTKQRRKRLAAKERERAAQREAQVASDAAQCTFRPAILESAKRRRRRTVEELSIGDAMRRDAIIIAMQKRAELKELQQATFRPEIHELQGVSGKLKLDESYLERVQYEREKKELEAERIRREREAAELRECKFRPEIHDAPAYVKRIARSMAIARPRDKRQDPPPKPSFRFT